MRVPGQNPSSSNLPHPPNERGYVFVPLFLREKDSFFRLLGTPSAIFLTENINRNNHPIVTREVLNYVISDTKIFVGFESFFTKRHGLRVLSGMLTKPSTLTVVRTVEVDFHFAVSF